MKLLYNFLTFAVLASALPSTAKYNSNTPKQIGKDGALMTAGQCQIGQHYCFGAIIGNLKVAKQDILDQYCDQKYESDPESCSRHKKYETMPDYWDGQRAWSSVFECTGPEMYKWVGRCEGKGSVCSRGMCHWMKAGGLIV